jgi:hypothetical protein
MYTPADSSWVRENRNREVYQASEARWSTEGVVMASQGRTPLIKRLLSPLRQLTKPTHSHAPLNQSYYANRVDL